MIKKKKEKELFSDDSWMYTLLLSTLLILGESLKTYTFTIKGVELTYTVFIIPILFLITNYITKKYSFERSVSAICLSTVALVLFTYGINYSLSRQVSFLQIGAETCAYLVSQMVNLYIYIFLLNNTKSPILLVLLNYVFSLIVFYMFYTIINLSIVVTDTYWTGYFITLVMQIIECLVIAFIDNKIKRGLEK